MTTIVLAPYNPHWPAQFREAGAALRGALEPVLGAALTRIDHIGSTAVPGLAAKPVLDVQVSVRDFAPGHAEAARLPAAIEALGLAWLGAWSGDRRSWPFDRRKWMFARRRPHPPGPLGAYDVNLHVRREGCVSQQQALLLRDFLRGHPEACARYEGVKRGLARREWATVNAYATAKGDCIWALLREADEWSWGGWRPGPSDA
jgi:GrpB-like predicted nucleotidyltransferase (UPF0157 family)